MFKVKFQDTIFYESLNLFCASGYLLACCVSGSLCYDDKSENILANVRMGKMANGEIIR